MVQVPDTIKKTIQKYLRELKRNNIPVQRAILFGSYARGNFHALSDIDLALVSSIFKGDRIEDRAIIRAITLSVSSEIEVVPFHPKDFNRRNPFAKEILQHGIEMQNE